MKKDFIKDTGIQLLLDKYKKKIELQKMWNIIPQKIIRLLKKSL